ncbi:hypothetical protein EUGRSUZ_F00778 [Eucalyptus grandis]|uniref:Uncharacterized protein n=2 Tax=Eucalyptus grandis TaxID=71139 RepID=A0ACC3KCC4_EUCGR|nr:hypothetical protein EUGRSUZ_F00778 [Eucalyptus grandis]
MESYNSLAFPSSRTHPHIPTHMPTPTTMNILIILLLFLLPVLFLLSWRRRGSSRKLPPGLLGIPIIGQSLDLLRAMRTNTGEEWLHERVRKYGPISKLSLSSAN